MMKSHIYISFIALSSVLFSCHDHNENTLPQEPVITDGELLGSFVGKFSRFSKGESYQGTVTTEWNDTVWTNERVHQQIMLWTSQESVSGLSYEVSDITNGENIIPSENVSLRFIDYVMGDAQALTCGYQENRSDIYIGDALSENVVSSVSTTDPLKIWITVNIPKGIPAGRYAGTLSVDQGANCLMMFDLSFVVVNRELPDQSEWKFNLDLWQFPFQLASLGGVEPFSTAYYSMVSPFYELLSEAGQKSITTYIKDGTFNKGQTMIDWTLTKDGEWKFDYSNFDSYVEFMQSLGIDQQINCFSLGGWYNSIGYQDENRGIYTYKNIAIGADEYTEIWSYFLDDFASHLIQKGWMDKAVIYMDENLEEDLEKIVNLINSNNSKWKIGYAGRELNTALERKLYDYSTIIGYDRTATNNTKATFYTSCSQSHPNNYVTLETETAEMTWMAWHALAKGFNGYTRWAFDYWTKSDPTDVRDGTNSAGDFNMIYRTGNGADAKPVSSIRFEMLREGIQDYEKAKIIGTVKMQDVISLFADTNGTNAKANVLSAQEKLKQLSVK
ncbi:MAG: DUF4091 domain-containing protein [Bacteroidales bacterium]|nr:DUF4091 domain-containing protein [Bacteroidales bacterium]